MTETGPFSPDGMTGRRREGRLRVRLAAKLITLDGEYRGVLADLSTRGARIEAGYGKLRPGQEAVMQWEGAEAFGIVTWVVDGSVGLRFYDPLDRCAVMAARRLDDRMRLVNDEDGVRQSARAFVQGAIRL